MGGGDVCWHPGSLCDEYQRQTEIEAWLRASSEPWRKWVAIDDKPWLFKPFLPNLICTDSEIGFDEDAEKRLIEFLDRNFG